MHEIDVFVCFLATDNKSWIAELEQDLKNEPVNYRFIEVPPGNLTASRRLGFGLGTAPYICHIDSDDRITTGVFSKMLEAIKVGTNVSLVTTGEDVVDVKLKKLRTVIPSTNFSYRQLVCDPAYTHSLRLYRREIVECIVDDVAASLITTDLELAIKYIDHALNHGYTTPVILPIASRKWRSRENSTCHSVVTIADRKRMRDLFYKYYCLYPDRYDSSDTGRTPAETYFKRYQDWPTPEQETM